MVQEAPEFQSIVGFFKPIARVADWFLGCKVEVMTPEERERMNKLCAQIQIEQDRQKFTQLIKELNTLVEAKEHRLENRESCPTEAATRSPASEEGRSI